MGCWIGLAGSVQKLGFVGAASIYSPQRCQGLGAIRDAHGLFGLQVADECVDHRHRRVQQFADAVFPQAAVDVKLMDHPVPRFDHPLEFRVQGDDSPTNSPSPAEDLAKVYSEPFSKGPLDAVQILKTVPPDDDILDRCLSFRDGESLGHFYLAGLPLEPFSSFRIEFQQYLERTTQKVFNNSQGERHEGVVQDALGVHVGEGFEIGPNKAF